MASFIYALGTGIFSNSSFCIFHLSEDILAKPLFKYSDICHYKDVKRIKDEKKILDLIRTHGIHKFFTDPKLPFELYQFEKGEYMNNLLEPDQYISFVTSGTIRILNIRDDGSLYEIASGSGFSCIGDLEFGSGNISPYLVEVVRRTYCIVLPLKECRKKLENDPVFLRYVLKSITQKLHDATAMAAGPKTLEEKVLFYMEHECEEQTLKGVEKASYALSCSRRQLLRILKRFCEEEKVIKTGKGTYVLLQ